MSVTAERKAQIITDFATKSGDTGSRKCRLRSFRSESCESHGALQGAQEGQPFASRPAADGVAASLAARLPEEEDEARYQALIQRLGIRR